MSVPLSDFNQLVEWCANPSPTAFKRVVRASLTGGSVINKRKSKCDRDIKAEFASYAQGESLGDQSSRNPTGRVFPACIYVVNVKVV